MNSEAQASPKGARFRKDLDREAVELAMKGDWERAAEVNRAILELFSDDVESMNRLTKALIELGSYEEANNIAARVCQLAPYNNIARKNRARLAQMGSGTPAITRHARRASGTPQLFIGESGKSAATLLRHTPRGLSPAAASPGEPIRLVIEHHGISVYSDDGDFLGQIEPRLGHRLSRLIQGGNTYEAAVIGFGDDGISIMLHETYRHRSMQKTASFPTRAATMPLPTLQERDDGLEDLSTADDDSGDDDAEEFIEEEELQAAWNENE